MKVLERKEQPTAIVTCPHCGSVLEIERGDISLYEQIDYTYAPCITCAVCHTRSNVESLKNINKLFLQT